MDSNELKSLADTQFARNTFLNNVNESYKAKLSVVHNGGMFVAKPELISFLNSWHEPELHVEDEYKNKIKIYDSQVSNLNLQVANQK